MMYGSCFKLPGKRNCFDQDSLAFAIFWTYDAKLIILLLLIGMTWDQEGTQQPATSATFHQRMVQSFVSQ